MEKRFKFRETEQPVFRPRVTEIIKVGATDVLTCIVISDKPLWVGTHWANDVTRPCEEPQASCKLCKRKAPFRWQGYLHVWLDSRQVHGFLELTDFAGEKLLKLQGDRKTLRACVLHVHRERKAKNAPLAFAIVGTHDEKLRPLGKERDVRPTLERIWKL